MLKSKKQEAEEKEARALEAATLELNSIQGKALALVRERGEATLCTTRYPMQLARKLAKKFPQAEFDVVVISNNGYEDQDYEIRLRLRYKDVEIEKPGTDYLARERAVSKAKEQLKALQELPPIESLRLYAQGASDALGEAEKVRKELDEIKQRRDDRDYPRLVPMFHPYFR